MTALLWEIHGHKKTETIMAKFENTDGQLA
jgi:hypothetical protein